MRPTLRRRLSHFPVSRYGESKLAGERNVLAGLHSILRHHVPAGSTDRLALPAKATSSRPCCHWPSLAMNSMSSMTSAAHPLSPFDLALASLQLISTSDFRTLSRHKLRIDDLVRAGQGGLSTSETCPTVWSIPITSADSLVPLPGARHIAVFAIAPSSLKSTQVSVPTLAIGRGTIPLLCPQIE